MKFKRHEWQLFLIGDSNSSLLLRFDTLLSVLQLLLRPAIHTAHQRILALVQLHNLKSRTVFVCSGVEPLHTAVLKLTLVLSNQYRHKDYSLRLLTG